MAADREIHFGRFRLHPVQGLSRGSREIHVTPKSLALLRALAARAGEVVTKDELFQQVWPRAVVTEASLATCIQELRTALQDDARHPRYIETVHRRGYRFIGRAVVDETERDATAVVAAPELIVGREPALEQLAGALAQARAGARQVVFISGEPGIGKTALVETFIRNVPTDAEARITRGDCMERYGAGEAYQPLLEALTRLCRQPGRDQSIATLRKFAPTWLAQLPALQAPGEFRTLQRRTAGVTPPRMLRELTDALEAMTARAPIALILEDLHWSDVSTLDWISAFARRREPARVLLIGTYRSTETHPSATALQGVVESLRLKGLCREIVLGGLDETAVVDYVTARHPPARHQEGPFANLARLVQRHTEGNPLFIVNVLRDLALRGLLVERDGQWSARSNIDAASLGIPEDVRRTIEQQIDRLAAPERNLLTVASACGASCSAAAVAAGAEVAVSDVESVLGALTRQNLFVRELGPAQWPDGTDAANFEFLHALYREVLAHRISPARSAEIHRLVGIRLESAYGSRAAEVAAELAMHFDRAHDVPRAITYLHHAARTDQVRSAHREAKTHLSRALELLESQPESVERDEREVALRIGLGAVLIATQGFGSPEVESCYSRARELCKRPGSARERFAVLWGLWVYYLDHGPLSSSREIADELSELAQRSGDSGALLQAHHAQWATMFSAGDMAATEDYAERGIALYDAERHAALAASYGGHDAGVCARNFKARAAVLGGRTETAVRAIDESIAHARELAHPFSLALALAFAAFVHQARRDPHAARHRALESAAISREHSFVLMHGWASVIEGWALAELGDPDGGIPLMREGAARARTNGSSLFLPVLLGVLTEAQLKCGRVSEARTSLAEALALAARTGDQVSLSELDRLSGELCLVDGAAAQAEQHLRVALERTRAQGARLLELRTAVSLSRSWLASGKRAEAHGLLTQACAGITEAPALPDLVEARALLAAR